MGISDLGFLLHLYYGPRTECDMSYILQYYDRGYSGNPYDVGSDRTYSLDVLPQEYPCYGSGDFRSPAVNIRNGSGVFGIDLRYRSHRFIKGKYAIPGLPAVYAKEDKAQTLEVVLKDAASLVEVTLKYGVLPELDVITRSAVIKNCGKETVYIGKAFSAVLDFVQGDFDLLHFYGRHAMERNLERTPLIHGSQRLGSRRGASSHQHNPFFILADKHTGEDAGDCYGMSLLYSGNFGFEVERDQYDQTRMQLGISDEMLDYSLAAEECFYTPEAALAYTANGLTALSHIYHRLIRYHVCRGKYKTARRPVVINNWEATYMKFDGKKLIDIAREAAELGVEMFVLDDGWFGKRDHDDRALGDWYVNEEKLGGTLHDIVSQINEMGMKFGIWIEPEMVNEDSELYRKHPEWAYVIPGKKPVRCREQLVLDFSRKEVVDYIFEQIVKVLDSANIAYIKMDMNRSIHDVYTAVEGYQNYGRIMYEYVLGVYDFLERLICRYPDILIEGCCGGGGRFDAGMLYYTPQIWCSDDTDAIERIRIQHGTSFGYPISAVGSHVSASPNHQTGRETNIHTRSVVAMAGSFGYELDVNLLTPEEKEAVRQQIREYKKYWDLIHNGDYYRLHTPGEDAEMAAWNFVSKDKKEALLNVVSLTTHANPNVSYVQCRGLDPKRKYYCEADGRVYDGSALGHMGVQIPVVFEEYHAWQFYFTAWDEKEAEM
ncbi:alpha-galactosidase [Lachnospiraceae bacterium 47-T17]